MSQNNQNKTGEHYVVDGAVFKCKCGSVPCQISVVSKPKVTAQNKSIVTEDDVTFASPSVPFATCTLNPTPSGPGPCAYANGKWTLNTLLSHGGKNVATESSSIFCPKGGKISCVYHGQVQSVTTVDFNEIKKSTLISFPFVAFPDMYNPDEKIENNASVVYGISVSKKVVRLGEVITLQAYDNDNKELTYPNVVNWEIATKKEENGDGKIKKGTYLEELLTVKKVSSPFNIKFDNPGVYYIEGGSDKLLDKYGKIKKDKPLGKENSFPFYKECATTVEVLDRNRIESSYLVGESINGGDEEKDHKGDDRLYIVKCSDKKVYIHVATCLPLAEDEELELKIDGEFTGNMAHKPKIGLNPAVMNNYCFTIDPIFFNNHVEKKVTVALTNSKKEELDSVSYRIKYVDGYVSPIVSHDIFGKNPIPKDSYVRQGATICLTVSPTETYDKVLDLKNAVWEIVENKISQEPKLKGSLIFHSLKTEGKVTIKLDLSKCNTVINNKKLGVTRYEHTFNVSRNVIKGVVDTPKVWYPGISYPIKFDLLYEYDCSADNKVLKFKLDGKEKELSSSVYGNNVYGKEELGKHCVAYAKNRKFEFEVVSPSVKTWQFSDERENLINEVGLEETFYLDIDIPVWADYQKYTNVKDGDVAKVKFYLWNNKGKSTSVIEAESLKNAKMGDNGKAHITLKISKDELARHLGTYQFPEKVSIIASLTNPPYMASEILTQKREYTEHWICNNAIPLTLVTQPCVTGYFSGRSYNPQKSVMKYGDTIYIILSTHNCKEMMDKITVELYENNKVGDDDTLISTYDNLQADEYGKVKIEISDKFADDNAHGENPNPRLFYFRVRLGSDVVYSYPQTQEDVFNMTYRKECEECNTAVVEFDGETHSVTSSDSKAVTKVRSYLWQLKVGKDKQINELNKTLAMMAPVVVGEELRKGEKREEDDCKCPRCHEDWKDLAKRLKEVFHGAKEENINTVAQTYCKYARRFGMDSCWIKAHFFAQVYVESRLLEGKTESLDYSVKGLMKSSFPYFNGHLHRCEMYGRISEKKVNGKYKDLPDNYNKPIKSQSSKPEEIANIVYKTKNGNEGGTDGWNFRGRGLIQLTGKDTYKEVGRILEAYGMDKENFECDLVKNREKVASDLELATVASMAFFRYKKCNMHVKCNGEKNADKISEIVGGSNTPLRKGAFQGGKGKFGDGTEVDLEGTYKIFELDDCQWDKIECTDNCPSYHTFFSGRVEKHIPKGCDESKATHYIYYYHKEDGTVVEICTRTIVRDGLFKLNRPSNSTIPSDSEIKKNNIKTWKYPKPVLKPGQKNGIDGDTIYFMPNGDKIVSGKEGTKKYTKSGNETIELVKIDEGREDGIFEFSKDGVNLYYEIDKTQTVRFYSDPNTFAILIGILAELGSNTDYNIKFRGTGNAEIHGTGYPSVTHRNGMSLDFCYSENKDDYEEVRKIKDIALLKAGIKFNCMTRLTGTWNCRKKGREAYSTKPEGDGNHNNHIHLGPFNQKINEPTIIKEN